MARARKPIPEYLTCPFTIIMDSNEGLPFQFQGHSRRHSSGKKLPLVIQTERQALWAMDQRDVTISRGKKSETHRVGYADYSIKGLERYIQIERKEIGDLFGTIGGRHSRFEAEIKRLHEDCLVSAVVIEATLAQISVYNTDASTEQVRDSENPLDGLLVDDADLLVSDDLEFTVDARPRFGKTSPEVVLGTISSWKQKYRNVHWEFCGNRSMAEMWTLKILQDFWDKVQEGHWPNIGPTV